LSLSGLFCSDSKKLIGFRYAIFCLFVSVSKNVPTVLLADFNDTKVLKSSQLWF